MLEQIGAWVINIGIAGDIRKVLSRLISIFAAIIPAYLVNLLFKKLV